MNNLKLLHIHGLSHDGRGLATLDNKTTFVAGALPNETVTYQITQKRGSYIEAQTREVMTASENRATPPCQHFGVCGGCSLQHMTIATQLELKQQTLLDQLKHFGKVTPESVLAPLTSDSIGYRRKARLGAKFVIKKDKVLVGFREKSSSYLADLERCVVLHPNIGERLIELATLIATLSIYKHIPQIEIAVGDTEAALVFRHMEPMTAEDKEKLIAYGKAQNFHIYLQPNSPERLTKLWPDDQHERITYTLPEENLKFEFHPLDFTQINLEINRLMVKQAMQLLDVQPTESVLDLYCGIGNFTLPLARRAKHVTGIEGSAEMTARATENAKLNQIENVSFYPANLAEEAISAPWAKVHYDKILLDPPRVGAKEILPLIASMGAKRIVYVSCNPATLARDAGELVHQHRYRLLAAGMMNMFPHTAHIEAMAVFEKEAK